MSASAAGIGPTTCETKELQHKYYYDLRRRACTGAAGIGPTTCETNELQHKYYYDLRRRACPGAAGIGPTICETKELQHKYYYDREASPSGFAGAHILDLEDKSVVTEWGTKYGTLYIYYVDGREEKIEWEFDVYDAQDFKRGDEAIEDAANYDVEYEEEPSPEPTA